MAASLPDSGYVRRVALAVGLVVLAAALVALVWYAFEVLLVVFAGALVAVLLDGLARSLAARSPLGRRAALAVVLAAIGGGLGLFGWLAGPSLAAQVEALGQSVPEALQEVRAWLARREWGASFLTALPSPDEALNGALGSITGAFSSVLGGLANLLIILFIAIYGAFEPHLYVDNAIRLVPPAQRTRSHEVASTLGRALRSWLKGQFASMAVVGVLTGLGLWIVGVPMALALGVIAGLLAFVPYLGPIVSAVPGVLIGLLEGPETALYALVVYQGVQLLESYILTPLIQEYVVSMPPAVLITGEVLFGVFAGVLGIAMATPLLVCLIVLVQMLYVEGVLEEDVAVMGE